VTDGNPCRAELEEFKPTPAPCFNPGLRIRVNDGGRRGKALDQLGLQPRLVGLDTLVAGAALDPIA
jgi:hypothetical protein